VRGPAPDATTATEIVLKQKYARLFALFVALATPLLAQYGGFGGPSILSRGMNGGGRTGSNPIGFRLFGGVLGNYSTNLNSFSSDTSNSYLLQRDLFGASGVVGAQGYKTTARTATSVDFLVSYAWTARRDVSRGLSESLSVTHSRQISRRVMWFLGVQAQSTNRALAFANSRYSPEPLPELTPQQEEIFDTRTYRANVGTGITFQKSSRLSFSAQVGAFGNERKSKILVDSRGFMGQGSVQYSLSRRQYVGAAFSYGTFYFPGAYGESRFYTPQGYYGVSLSRAWNLNLFAGMYSAHTDRLVSVQLDPFIAQLTGQSTTLEIYRGDNRGFSGGISLTGTYRRWGVSISAARGLMPGNGFYLTSEQTSLSASMSHTLGRRASWSLYARGAESRALTQTLGKARFYSVGTSVNYRINTFLNFNTNAGVFRTRAAGSNIEFDRFIASAGIFFSPGELPLHIF